MEDAAKERPAKTARASFVSLEHLFGSKTRARLLSLFLHHPERKFFVRELSREVASQIHAVRRELDNLEKLLILKSGEEVAVEGGKKSKKKFYWIERNCVIFPELQSLVLKAELFVEHNLGEHIKNFGEFFYIALTGRLTGDPDFPVDMFLIGTAIEAPFKKFLAEMRNHIGYEINYTLLSPEEFRYRKEVTDRFLYSILEGKKTVLVDRLEEIPKPEPEPAS